MSTPDRIAHVKKQLDLLYEQLDQLERTELLTSDPLIRVQIRQQIRESIQPKIDQYKAEELQLQSNNRFPAQSNSRLSEMKTCLHRLYEQLANKEKTKITIAPEEKIRIQQQIDDLKVEIQQRETEYEKEKAKKIYTFNAQEVTSQTNHYSSSMTARFPLQVYLSCSSHPDDTKLRDRLASCLSIFEKEERIKIWHRGKIQPGMNTIDEVKSWIKLSTVFLILVSHDYISSQIHENPEEYNLIIAEHQNNMRAVVPVILSPCSWDRTGLKEFQCLPKNRRPISGSREWNQKTAFNTIIEECQEFFCL